MPKENKRSVNSKTVYEILAENVKLLEQQHSEERASMDQTTRICQVLLSDFHRPIPLYPNASYPSQVGYSNSRTRGVAMPIVPEPTLEEQRAASAKDNRLRRKKRKGKLITKEDELTDQEKIAKNAYNRNQKKGNFSIPISMVSEPTLEEQRAANLKSSFLNKKKQKGEIITKEDELTNQEKIALNAYIRNEMKRNLVNQIFNVPEPTLEEQRTAVSKEGRLYRKKLKGKVITKEDELTDQEKLAFNAYKRNQSKGKFVKSASIFLEPTQEEQSAVITKESRFYKNKRKIEVITNEEELTALTLLNLRLPTRNMLLSHEEGRTNELPSKRRKGITKV